MKIGITLESIAVCIHYQVIIENSHNSMQHADKLKTVLDKISEIPIISIN